ncbi:HAD family hydrolase [Sorangium sp. So ce302]|uniref:HAD family hydrolase n=1 Tax=Sorangium sp. So ce302 TaxID=3133297 RepID=UPI003F5EE81B
MADLLPRWDSDNVESLRQFADVQLVAVDIDGTVVSTQTADVFRSIAKLQRTLSQPRHGVTLIIATGRTLAGVLPVVAPLGLPPATPLVLYNGSVVVTHNRDTTLLHRSIPNEALGHVLTLAERYRASVFAYIYTGTEAQPLGLSQVKELVLGWSSGSAVPPEFNGMDVQWRTNYGSVPDSAAPSAILIDISTLGTHGAELLLHLRDIRGISPTQSGPRLIEIRPDGSNKAMALGHVANRLHIAREHTLAIGDNDNDVEMLRWAKIGVAVATASPAARSAAGFICHYGVAKGVVEVLKTIRHAKRFFSERGNRHG